MAPKRRRTQLDALVVAEGVKKLGGGEATVEGPPLRRFTRSTLVPPPQPKPKAAYTGKKRGRKAKTTSEEEEGAKSEVVADDVEKEAGEGKKAEAGSLGNVIIERCTQCQAFARRANEVQAGLETALPGINVLINPKKPRRGCFEIRVEGDTEAPVVSLLDMKRPFQKMKDLKMEQVIAGLVKRIQG